MVRVIMGVKGTGKTKQMIELINSAVHSENGNVVCIERGPKLTYDIHYKIRLVEASHYDIKSYDFLKGFISGLYAGNYDITHVFIDSLTKIVASEATDHAVEEFLDWLNSFSEKNNIKFTVTISADASLATDGVKNGNIIAQGRRYAPADNEGVITMVRVIMGVKGTGKTKQMIELINSAVHSENGNVVCIERGPKLTYDIHYKIRLVEASHYDIKSYDFLKGFISGLYAGNYDITHVFIDSLTKIVASEATDHAVEEFLDWLNSFSEKNNIKFTVTISADASLATDGVKKYF